jgi:hypothetical protein
MLPDPPMSELCFALARVIERRPRWLDDVLSGRILPEREVALAFGAASRDVGDAPLRPDARELAALREAGAPWTAATTIDEVARVVLLHAAVGSSSDPLALVRRLYTGGDSRERAAILRALPLLPAPSAFLSIATEGCRTNVHTVFEAIACENAYPARWFPEPAFCQMALKAIFVGVSIARIEGLRRRTTSELRRMARAYASERIAAGRSVPADVHALLASAPVHHGEPQQEERG